MLCKIMYYILLEIKLNNCNILDVNKFKKENNDDGTEDKNEIGIGKIIIIYFF